MSNGKNLAERKQHLEAELQQMVQVREQVMRRIFQLEGAIAILTEQLAEEPSVADAPLPNRAARRRAKAQAAAAV